MDPLTAPVVHVRDETARECRPALVLALPYGSFDLLRCRVIAPSGLGVGIEDVEGFYSPTARPTYADSPGGGRRMLDHWHPAPLCPFAA